MTEKCFSTIAKTMAAMNPETSYIQTIIEATVTPLTSAPNTERLLMAARQANARPCGAKDFSAILGKLLISFVNSGKLPAKSLFTFLFAVDSADKALLDEATINEVVGLLIEVDPVDVYRVFAAGFPSESPPPFNLKVAVRCKKLMEVITVRAYKIGARSSLRIPPGYESLVAAWKALLRTGDSAFLQTFCEMGRAIIDAAASERVSQAARDGLGQFFTVVKGCLCVTDEGRDAWISLQTYGVRALKGKKTVQTVIGHI
jgi:hypothetical protein